MNRKTCRKHWDFTGQLLVPAVASGTGTEFVKKVTAAAGSPTVQGANGGGIALAFDNTNEVQNLCLYLGDILPFDIDDLISFEAVVKAGGTLNSAVSFAMGVASARNDAIDSIAEHASIRAIGNNTIVVESDDGTTDKDDIATGLTLSTSWQRFRIDFVTGVATQEPPSLSLGGKANVAFYGGNSNGSLRRVASGTRFDMSAYAGNLQPYFQLQKTASTTTNYTVTVRECTIEYREPA